MARNQIYRGNPEVKQSVIFDNFSGGINTTDIDDQMLTNEFRVLRNAELTERGRVQNRKGFSNLVVFNEWLAASNVNLPERYYYMFYPILDEYSTFDKLKEYGSFDDFKQAYESMEINIMFVIAYKDSSTIYFDKLHLTHTAGEQIYTAQRTSRKTKVVSDTTKFVDEKLTGINVEVYDGKYYVLLNNINSNEEGIVEFKIEDNDLVVNIYDKGNSYIPTPYEVSNIGFNILSDTPTMQISSDNSFVEEIRSIFLSDVNDNNLVLSKIPKSGKFNLNLIYKGTEDLPAQLRVRFYVETDLGEKQYLSANVTLISNNTNTGIAVYYVSSLSFSNYSNIFISITKSIENTDIPYVKQFDSLTDAVDFYVTRDIIIEKTAIGYGSYFIPKTGSNYGYEYETISNYNPAISTTSASLPMIRRNSSGILERDMNYRNLADTFAVFIVYDEARTTPEYVTSILYVNPFGYPQITDNTFIAKKALGNNVVTDSSLYTPSEYLNVRVNLDSTKKDYSYGTELQLEDILAPEQIIYLTNTFVSFEAARRHIETYYDLESNDGNIYRVNKYSENGVCYVLDPYSGMPVGDLTYTTQNQCEAVTGAVWYSDDDPEYWYIQFTYVDTYTTYINYDFYIYNGGQTGAISDFTKATFSKEIEILSYTDLYNVNDGSFVDKAIEPINLEKARHIIIKDRMFIYSGNTIIVSDTYSELDSKSFSYFPNYNYVVLSLEANDSIQRMAYFRGSYLIFTKKKIYRMSGTFMQDDFTITTINDALGCISPDSIRSINNTLIFVSEDGLYTVKQNFYQNGIENLDKIDRQVKGVIPRGTKHESILYNEQYMLFVKDEENNYLKTVKQYYNMQYATRTFPYVVDEYVIEPDLLFKVNGSLNAIQDGQVWVYDVGYTDFAPADATATEIEDYLYKWSVVTPYWTVGYPLHEKKFKTFYLKVDSDTVTTMYFSIFVDKAAYSTSYEYMAKLNGNGEVEYFRIANPVELEETADTATNIIVDSNSTPVESLDPDLVLGDFELGRDLLTETKYQVHKLNVGAKGKSIAIQIEQKKNSYFALDSIGIVYKLGKMRESR